MTLEQISTYFTERPSKLFLIDGIGALISASFLIIILNFLYEFIGMPAKDLYYLSIAPCIFAVFSFYCYLRKHKNWESKLAIIAIANLVYCAITFSLLFLRVEQLTIWGYTYFIIEIILVVILALFELKVSRR